MSRFAAECLSGSMIAGLIFTLTFSSNVAAQYKVTELTFNGGANGEKITFDSATDVDVTLSTDESTLDVLVSGTDIRIKCSEQSSPGTCVIYANSGVPALDTDGDGVTDNLDQCAGTPTGSTVDEQGCRDRDGDGISELNDKCPNTPQGTVVDENGCSEDQLSPDTQYCAGVNTTAVSCSATTNHDSIYVGSVEYSLVEPAGSKILSVPFTTVASASARGYISYTSGETGSGESMRFWLSTTPGGDPVNSGCDGSAYPRLPIYWTQDQGASGCFIGTEPQVLYWNYSVTVEGSPRSTNFNFFAQRYVLVAP